MTSLEDLVRMAMEGRVARQEVQNVTTRLGAMDRRVGEVEAWKERAEQMADRMERASKVLESAAEQVDRDRANELQRRAEEDASRKADMTKMQAELMAQITLLMRPPGSPQPTPPAGPTPATLPSTSIEMETETPTPVPSATLSDATIAPAAQEATGGVEAARSAAEATAAQEGTVVAFAATLEPTEELMPDSMTEEQVAMQIKADQAESKRLQKLRAIRETELAQAMANEVAATPEYKEKAGEWLRTAQRELAKVVTATIEHEKVAMKAPEPKKRAYDVALGMKGKARSKSAERARKEADA
jgi:glycine cleavage system H lipoate-binding protein